MLSLIVICLMLVSQSCRDFYLSKVLTTIDYSKYYVVVKAKTPTGEGEIVVINGELYGLMKKRNRKLESLQSYKDYFTRKIVDKEPILISNKEIKKINAGFVNGNDSSQTWAQHGVQNFVEHFFTESGDDGEITLKREVASEMMPAIVKTLFNWNYFVFSAGGKLVAKPLHGCQNLLN